jgi:hypothetical protein
MSRATIEFCGLDAVDELMAFIRDHWSADHILGHSRALMDWQHRDEAAGRYNFLLALDASGTIVGILGFIPSSRYDAALANAEETIWFAMWKVLDSAPAGVGLMLIRELQRRFGPKWIGTVGLNAHVRQIYNALGYRTAALERHYRLNDAVAAPRLMVRPADWPPQPRPAGTTPLLPVSRADFWTMTENLGLDDGASSPRKSRAHFFARYLEHPFYDYRLFLARGEQNALIAMRTCSHDGGSALRIVDLLGCPTALAGCGPAFDALLSESGAEYLDFYTSNSAGLAAAGFRQHFVADALILPSYFEPFDRSNVEVVYALKGPGDARTICKGDADQDRPNVRGHGV